MKYILCLRNIMCLPACRYNEVLGQRVDIVPQPTNTSSTRVFVGGLVLPTIAKLVGDVLFHSEQSCLKKCLMVSIHTELLVVLQLICLHLNIKLSTILA